MPAGYISYCIIKFLFVLVQLKATVMREIMKKNALC